MFINENVMKNILENYEDLLIADGYDDAIIGVSTKEIVIYSIPKILEILVKDGMDEDEALHEYSQAYANDKTKKKPGFWAKIFSMVLASNIEHFMKK